LESVNLQAMSAEPRPAHGVACVVLAAGAGRRFGAVKQLAPLAGRPLLDHALAVANASEVERVVLVLGAHAQRVRAGVAAGRAEVVVCDDWRKGMAAPLRLGIETVADAEAALILLGDQPLVTRAAIERVLAARTPGSAAVRATYDGAPGHPVVLERTLFGAVAELGGDEGARSLLAGEGVATVACEDVADPLDVDSPADLERAAARLGG
jgi:CTP:molybdopterin cytidylyltransferase MocA